MFLNLQGRNNIYEQSDTDYVKNNYNAQVSNQGAIEVPDIPPGPAH